MAETPCPAGDKGICSYPDRVLFVTGGKLSVVSAAIADDVLKRFEPTSTAPLEWMPSDRYEEVVDLVLDSLRAQSPRSVDGWWHGPSSLSARELRGELERIEALLAAENELSDGIIVTCSCGHTWVKT